MAVEDVELGFHRNVRINHSNLRTDGKEIYHYNLLIGFTVEERDLPELGDEFKVGDKLVLDFRKRTGILLKPQVSLIVNSFLKTKIIHPDKAPVRIKNNFTQNILWKESNQNDSKTRKQSN